MEINPLGEAPFRESAAALAAAWEAGAGARSSSGVGGRGSGPPRLEYVVAAAGSDPGRWLEGAEVAIVDPPRKGLEPALLDALRTPTALGQHPHLRRLLYLSCGWPAFQRDCAALLGGGGWRLAHAQGFAFFPATDHIETLAVFERV